MASFFSKINSWINKKYEEYFVIPKVDKALSDLKSIIEGDNNIKNNINKIERSRDILKRYPNILADRKMSYLNGFLQGDLGSKITTDMGEAAKKIENKLSSLIAKSIDAEDAKKLIQSGDFKPLAQEKIIIPNVSANSINIMYCGTEGEKSRCLKGSKEFLMKNGMSEENAKQKVAYLKKEYPYLLAVASLENIEQKNASSTIVTQREGFDLEQYRNEVNFVNEAREELTKITKNEPIDENKLKNLNDIADDIRSDYTKKGILKDKPNKIGSPDTTPSMTRSKNTEISL